MAYERETVELNNVRIVFRNFAGDKDRYNSNVRNFAIVLPDDLMALCMDVGFNVKERVDRETGEHLFNYIKVKINFTGVPSRDPNVYVVMGDKVKRMTENTIGIVDDIDILACDVVLNPYRSNVNGSDYVTPYLDSMRIIQRVDTFALEFEQQGYEIQ